MSRVHIYDGFCGYQLSNINYQIESVITIKWYTHHLAPNTRLNNVISQSNISSFTWSFFLIKPEDELSQCDSRVPFSFGTGQNRPGIESSFHFDAREHAQ